NASSVYIGAGGTASGVGGLSVLGGTLNVASVIQVRNTASTLSIGGLSFLNAVVNAAAVVAPDWGRVSLVSGILNLNGGTSSNAGNLVIGNDQGFVATLNQS